MSPGHGDAGASGAPGPAAAVGAVADAAIGRLANPAAAGHDDGPETAEEIAADIAAVARLSAVPTLLRVLCESTGMGFAAVARVSGWSWTACVVHDAIGFGIGPGGQLAVESTLCRDVRSGGAPIVFDHASDNADYRDHPTPRLYGIESYASFPIVLASGRYFGNLCCIDPSPARVDEPQVRAMFANFAELIGNQLDEEHQREQTRSALMSERAVSELREQFIAILGHDLRNPLAAVSACAHVLKLRSTEPGAAKLLDQMLKNVKRMARLIDDTLDFARGRLGGGLSLHRQWSSTVAEAIDEVVDAARVAHPQRAITSCIDVGGAVFCDVPRVQQIASNLVGNAITHGAAGGRVEIRARCVGGAFELSAWNEGEPIPPAALEKIFEPFWRAASGHHRDGLGLGLHICAEIARAHGGSLTVTSSASDGTLFVASLPIEGPSPGA